MSGSTPRRRNEDGIFIVLWALLLLALLIMVAIVIDLSALRADRRETRLAADAAVTAGAQDMGQEDSPQEGCAAAWDYVLRNLGFVPADATSSPGCASFPPTTKTCTAATARQDEVGVVAGYTVTISYPVPNGDNLLRAEAVGGDITQNAVPTKDIDGSPCGRIGVDIRYTRDSIFAKVAGYSRNSIASHSVARTTLTDGDLHPSLVVLEPHGCNAMKAVGTPSIEVIGTLSLRGGIVIISDGSTCPASGPDEVLNVGTGSDNSHVTAAVNGDIYLKAGNGSCTGSACDPNQADLDNCWNIDPALTTCTGYSPRPQAIDKEINRSRIDYLFNCRAGYTTGTGNYIDVTIDGSTMQDCPDTATVGDYINKTYQAVGTTGSGLRPAAYTTVIGTDPKKACPKPLPPLVGSVEFNCDVSGQSFTVAGDAWFRQIGPPSFKPGAVTVQGNAVFEDNVDVSDKLYIEGNAFFAGGVTVSGASADLRLRGRTGSYSGSCVATSYNTNVTACVKESGYTAGSPSAGAALAFFKGEFKQTGGKVTIDRVMVYGFSGARLNRAGGGDLTWLPPTTGPFKKLSFWSDATGVNHELSGNGALNVDGVFFAPNANFRLGGTPSAIPQDAQFWALRLEAAGTATFRMTPDPETPTVPLDPSVRLIR